VNSLSKLTAKSALVSSPEDSNKKKSLPDHPKLSLIMPSHNVGSRININILNASLMGNDDIEIIIRDNSGNADKRKFLAGIHEKNCRILSVDDCPGTENFQALLNEAKGDFVAFTADDDYANSFAYPSILKEVENNVKNPSIVGVTGIMVVDDKRATQVVCFNNLNQWKAADRLKALIEGGWPSIFQYSTLRRTALLDVWSFISKLPVYLTYHDLLINALTILHGRLVYTPRMFYQYNLSSWSSDDDHLKKDADSFVKAGLDASGVRVQWLIAAFEGAQAILNKYSAANIPEKERNAIAGFWFNHWFSSFLEKSLKRDAKGARFDKQAIALTLKWQQERDVKLDVILQDIVDYYALSSPEVAQRYYDFWK